MILWGNLIQLHKLMLHRQLKFSPTEMLRLGQDIAPRSMRENVLDASHTAPDSLWKASCVVLSRSARISAKNVKTSQKAKQKTTNVKKAEHVQDCKGTSLVVPIST